MIRTHAAGSLRPEHAGTRVVLTGWVARRRDHGGVAFLDLRDASGVVQVVVRPDVPAAAEAAHELRNEFCIRVDGEVALRPTGNENPDISTGEIEVVAAAVEVLSEAAPLPFPIEGTGSDAVAEEARLRWRYLDLRRPGPARAIRMRGHVTRTIRQVMDEHGFLDVETPYLTRSTPEGARDFLVPVRLQPGTFYALPQSPQLFKQLLMVAGLERYYQIVRCFRDEDFRADRQPEFTQLDLEMSFPDEEDIYALCEELLSRLWAEVLGVKVETPFPRMSYDEAMARYGSDRPDLRYGLELVELSEFFTGTGVGVFRSALEAGGYVGGVVVPGGAQLTRRQLDGWQDWARGRGAKGLAYVAVEPDGSLRSPLRKFLTEREVAGFVTAAGANPGDLVFLAAAPRREAQELLGALRGALARDRGLLPAATAEWKFLWVTDFPMFERAEGGRWTAAHHPFTSPTPADEADFHTRPGEARARAYDVVLNGNEIGGGSIRIHRGEVQQRVFDVIGLSREEAAAQFGFLLEAFRYGPPPHGGIAFGLDRLCALLAGTESIRDVIAFPKTASGSDPLTGAPTPITAAQRREAGLDAQPPAAPG